MWRGGLGRCLCSLLARPFVRECHNISTMLRFHIPLIEPDVQFSRIGLSDRDSLFRPREVAWSSRQLGQPQLVVQVFVRVV
jgi:hypothetical protein